MSGKVEIIKPEVKVEVEQKISQQDVIELVAYKQIKKLEGQQKEASDELEKVNEKMKDLDKKYKDSVLKEATKLLAPFLNIISETYEVKLTTVNSRLCVDVSSKGTYPQHFTIDTSKLSTTKTKTHQELEAKHDALKKTIDGLDKEVHKIKHDKNSIKNAITEQLLSESEEGKSLLALVENAYKDAFPKQLK